MRFSPPPPPETPLATRLLLVELPLALFVVVGLLGTLLVADDFEVWRFELAKAGVPLAIVYAAMRILYPQGLRRWPRLVNGVAVLLVLLFASGAFSLLNAATSDGVTVKRTMEAGRGIAVRDVQRGGLGWTFRRR